MPGNIINQGLRPLITVISYRQIEAPYLTLSNFKYCLVTDVVWLLFTTRY